MQLADLKQHLESNVERNIRFRLPNGEPLAAHAHVTEVARIDKRFVDCGGTFRTQTICRLQTWVSDDLPHRLRAGVLLKILQKSASFLETDVLEVDVEHELDYLTQFPLAGVEPNGNELVLRLAERHTECLAPEKCKPAPSVLPASPLKFEFAKP